MQFIIKFAVHVRSLLALNHKRWHLTASKNCIRMVNFQDEAERRNRSIVWMRFGRMLFVNRMLINSLASKNQVVSSWNRRTINWGWKTCWWIWFADSMKVWKFKSGKKSFSIYRIIRIVWIREVHILFLQKIKQIIPRDWSK